jgi:hypothetical protein
MNTTVTLERKETAVDPQSATRRSLHRLHSPGRFRATATFLCRAAIGGAFGGYLLDVVSTVKAVLEPQWYFIPIPVLLFIYLPVYMLYGAVLALVAGGMTLILENLIEEKLTMAPRAIATGVISALLLLGVSRFWAPIDWALIKHTLLPGFVVGVPASLFASTRTRLRHLLRYGVQPSSPQVIDLEANRRLLALGTMGTVALRLVSVVGFLTSIEGLIAFWRNLEVHERMVVIYAIYYFACTAFVTLMVRTRWMAVTAGTFLNGLLLVLALFWSPSGEAANPLPMAVTVLSALWLLFIVSCARPVQTRRLATSFQEK